MSYLRRNKEVLVRFVMTTTQQTFRCTFDDLLYANIDHCNVTKISSTWSNKEVLTRFELETFCVLSRRDNHYTTEPFSKISMSLCIRIRQIIDDLLSANIDHCNVTKMWRCRGLNPGPFTCKANALPLSYIPR